MSKTIGIDWGSSTFRCYELLKDGFRLLESSDAGVTRFGARGEMAAYLAACLDRNNVGKATVYLSGMVTSSAGWIETPYVAVPATLEDLRSSAVDLGVGERGLRFLPGVVDARSRDAEIMRGEEIQLMGLLAEAARRFSIAVLPGTHSKWVHLSESAIEGFGTFVTGELYEWARGGSLIGQFIRDGSDDRAAFDEGVQTGLAPDEGTGGLLRILFLVRSRGVLIESERGTLRSYLSGLLIGAEIRGGLARFPLARRGVEIVGASALAGYYRRAFEIAGVPAVEAAGGLAARGLQLVAKGA